MAVPEELEEDDEESPLEEFIVKPLLVFEELELEELFLLAAIGPKMAPKRPAPKTKPSTNEKKGEGPRLRNDGEF